MRCYSPKSLLPPLVFRRGVGEYIPPHLPSTSKLQFSIVEFASQEDAQRSVRELSEQMLLGRPVFIREVRSSPSNRVDVRFTNRCFRTERMNHVSAPLPSLGRLEWPWLAVGCMLHLPLDLPITITLAKRAVTLVTSCMLATCVVPRSHLIPD